jgi:hypothetical protein
MQVCPQLALASSKKPPMLYVGLPTTKINIGDIQMDMNSLAHKVLIIFYIILLTLPIIPLILQDAFPRLSFRYLILTI